jgi:chromosome segregation ATPase
MTIGKNNEAPAAYALTSTIQRLLDHLTESRLYSAKDLNHIHHTLESLNNVISNENGDYSDRLVSHLANRIALCRESTNQLQESLKRLDPSLADTHEQLISILRCISLANTKTKFSASEVKKFKEQVEEIQAAQVDGHFVTADGQIPAGNDEINELLTRILMWADTVLERQGVMPDNFKSTYEMLVNIRNELEKLSLTQAWSLRETDLYDFQRQLDKIDEARVDGNFIDADGNPAELYVQRTLLYLIRRSYGYIYYLMVSSEPVSEALQPVYNQLQTLRRCLLDVKEMGGVSSPRELYPYSMKVRSNYAAYGK